jgi:hypothetical protein
MLRMRARIFPVFAVLWCLATLGATAAPPNARTLGNSGDDRVRHANLIAATGRYADGLQELLAVWKSEHNRGKYLDLLHVRILESLGALGEIYAPAREAFEHLRQTEVDPSNDCSAHYHIAKIYASMGHNPEALAEYLWCWDKAPDEEKYAMSLRRGAVVNGLVALARDEPSAREALRARLEHPRFRSGLQQAVDRAVLERALLDVEKQEPKQ